MLIPTKQIVKFQDMDLEMLTLHGRRCFTAETIGKALQYSEPRVQVMRLFNRNREEFEQDVDFAVVKLTTPGGMQDVTVFFQTGVNLIGMFSEQPLAKAFRRWAKHVLAGAQLAQQQDSAPEFEEQAVSILEHVELQRKYICLLEERLLDYQTSEYRFKLEKMRILEKNKAKRRYKRGTPEEMAIIREMHLNGFSKRLIAETIGRSRAFVLYKLQQMGLEPVNPKSKANN